MLGGGALVGSQVSLPQNPTIFLPLPVSLSYEMMLVAVTVLTHPGPAGAPRPAQKRSSMDAHFREALARDWRVLSMWSKTDFN